MTPAYVYRAYDRTGALLYVGCTVSLDVRIRSHYLRSPWWHAAHRFSFTHYGDIAHAAVAEVEAIQREHPRWNVRDRAVDHPDGKLSRREVARLYPADDRRVTHPNERVDYVRSIHSRNGARRAVLTAP